VRAALLSEHVKDLRANQMMAWIRNWECEIPGVTDMDVASPAGSETESDSDFDREQERRIQIIQARSMANDQKPTTTEVKTGPEIDSATESDNSDPMEGLECADEQPVSGLPTDPDAEITLIASGNMSPSHSDYSIHDENEEPFEMPNRDEFRLALDWIDDLGKRSYTPAQFDYELENIRPVMRAVHAGRTPEEWRNNYRRLRSELMDHLSKVHGGRAARMYVEINRIEMLLLHVGHPEHLSYSGV